MCLAPHRRDAEDAEIRGGKVKVSEPNHLTEQIAEAAIEVHRHVGPGLSESAYRECAVQGGPAWLPPPTPQPPS